MVQVSVVERRSLSDSVFEQLRERIVGGAFGPGTVLPAERQLCEMLGVNRGALREALKRLQQAGLVSVQHGGHTQVTDFYDSGGLDLVGALLLTPSGTVNTAVARGILELRTAIAADAARLAAERATAKHGADLAAVVEAMRVAGDDLPERQRLAMEFWRQVILASDNVAYRLAHNSLRQTYDRIAGLLTQVLSAEFTNLAGYRQVLRAVKGRKGDAAARSARRLLETGSAQLFALLKDLERESARSAR